MSEWVSWVRQAAPTAGEPGAWLSSKTPEAPARPCRCPCSYRPEPCQHQTHAAQQGQAAPTLPTHTWSCTFRIIRSNLPRMLQAGREREVQSGGSSGRQRGEQHGSRDATRMQQQAVAGSRQRGRQRARFSTVRVCQCSSAMPLPSAVAVQRSPPRCCCCCKLCI
jgi:hypothetical protein